MLLEEWKLALPRMQHEGDERITERMCVKKSSTGTTTQQHNQWEWKKPPPPFTTHQSTLSSHLHLAPSLPTLTHQIDSTEHLKLNCEYSFSFVFILSWFVYFSISLLFYPSPSLVLSGWWMIRESWTRIAHASTMHASLHQRARQHLKRMLCLTPK